MRTVITSGLLILAPALAGAAPEPGRIELKTVAEKEVAIEKPNGEIELRRVPAGTVIPGDEVIYTIHATNISSEPVGDVVISDPIPEHTAYRDGSAIGPGAEITFSVDGGASFGPADQLVIQAADGGVRPATAADYTNIRWKFTEALAPGESRFVRFRATLR